MSIHLFTLMTTKYFTYFISLIFIGMISMSSVSAKLAVSSHAVQSDNNNNCYFGSISTVQTILKGITDEFANSVTLADKADVVAYVDLVKDLGDIHYKKTVGTLQDSDIAALISKNSNSISNAGISNIKSLISDGNFSDIIAAIKKEASTHFENTAFYFSDDLLLFFNYVEISAFLENYDDKNACVKPEILQNVDKLKGDLNQEDLSYSTLPDKLYLSKLELKNRFGFALYYTVKRETLKSLNNNVDLFIISNQGKDVLHLTKISIEMDKDFNVSLNILIDSNVQKIPILQNCNEFVFITGSIEKDYDSYKFHVSVRQFLSNRRDQIKTTLSPEQIEGALVRTTDIIKPQDAKRVNEIRCSDDPIEVQQDEIETVTQLTTVDILNGIKSLVDDCKVIPPDCDYVGENGECIKCTPPQKIQGKVCVEECQEGTYFDNKTQSCVNCGCGACNNTDDCTKCNDDQKLYKGKCYDKCPADTVETILADSIECVKCSPDCVVCIDKDTCKDCGLKYVYNGNCVEPCPPTTFPSYGTPPTCLQCTENCDTCIGKLDCQKCTSGYYEYNGNCIKDCPSGTYTDESKGECVDCPIHCKTCTQENCTECKDGFVLTDKGTCEDKCPDGTVKVADNSCAYCETHCEVCLPNDTTTCIKCDDTTVLRLGNCPENCNSNEYVDEKNECKPCSDNCAVCKDNSSCTICDEGYKLLNKVCVSPCPPGYYESGSLCLPCDTDSKCKTCDGKDNSLCIICLDNQVKNSEGKCVDKCSLDEYKVLRECLPCPTGCQNCNQSGNCLDCISPKFIENGQCVDDCSNGFHADQTECNPCKVSHCIKCKDDKEICDQCEEGYTNFNGICILECPSGTVKVDQTCVPCTVENCNQCPELHLCKECLLPLVLQDDGSCKEICKEGQFEINNKCQDCTVDKCKLCPNNPDCKECDQGNYLYNNTCGPCPVGTIADDETKTCKDCASPCLTCVDSQNKCTSCEVETMELINGECKYPCNENEVRTTSGDCIPCDLNNCLTCHPDRSDCIVCSEGYVKLDGQCIEVCPDGSRKTETNNCLPCRNDCQKCPLNSDDCLVCNEPYVKQNGVCVIICSAGYTLVGEECKRCQPPCKECNSNFECIDCPTGYVRYENQCLYLCPSGTYVDVNHQCPPCEIDDCGECKDLGKICEKCKLPNPLLYNNNCVANCPDGTTQVGNNCVDCEVNHCKTCDTSISECNVCEVNFFLITNVECGTCPSGTYPNYSTKTCDNCPSNCSTCDSSSCKECDSGYYLNSLGDCVKECESGYTEASNGTCVKCESTDCINCNSSNTDICIECKDGTYLDGQTKQCVSPCPDKTFPNNTTKTCDNCPVTCDKCTSEDKCTDCIDNYHLDNSGKCKDTCPDGLILSGTDCVVCKTGVECLKCDANDTEKCIICTQDKILFEGNCLTECPAGYRETSDKSCEKCPDFCQVCDATGCVTCTDGKVKQFNQCVDVCGLGYIEQNQECHSCTAANCLRCDNSNSCEACKDGYVLSEENGVKVCVEECKDGKYSNGTECHPCLDERCTGCSTEINCIKCEDGHYVFQQSQCVPVCIDGYIPVGEVCVKCIDPYCKICTSPNVCITCESPRTLENGNCVLICGLGYTNVDDNCVPCPNDCDHCPIDPDSCVQCGNGKVLDANNNCVDYCEDGSIPINDKCKECDIVHCKECYSNLTQCKECELGYKLNSDLKCVIDCPSNTYEKDGQCINCVNCPECNSSGCTVCVSPLVLNDGKCENQHCDVGKILVNDVCVDCKTVDCALCPNPDECYNCVPPKVLNLDKQCVLVCGVGEIEKDGKCESCIDNCLDCYSAVYCAVCNFPYVKTTDGSCILTCQNGTVNIDGVCVDCTDSAQCKLCHPDELEKCIICRDGYFLQDTKCVHQCDDGTYVEDKGGLGYECKECPAHCAYCSVSTICDRCEEGYVLKNNVCVKECDEGYVLVDYNCIKCTSDRCLKCEPSDPSYCDQCKSDYFNHNGECVIVCEDGTYANSRDLCINCTDPNCEKCSNNTTCIDCKDGWVLYYGECRPNCPPGYTANNLNECVPCNDPNCNVCKYYSTSICEECTLGYLNQSGQCVTDCGDGFYENNVTKKCTPCDVTCKNCVDGSICITCTEPAKLVGNNCVTECKDGESKVNEQCIPCTDKDCLKCPVSPDQCIKCDSLTYLYNNDCVTLCPDGTYPSNGKCENCNDDCNVCKTLAICYTCKSPKFTFNSACVDDCPPKYTRVGDTCIPCVDTDCLECGVPKTCDKCTNFNYNGDCVSECPSGTYPCPETKKCIDCIDNCDKCSNTYKCEKCDAGYLLQNDICVEKCKDGYIQVAQECQKCTVIDCVICFPSDLSICNKCKVDQILFKGECVDVCPSGYLPESVNNVLTCVPCSSNCKDCIQDPIHCIVCNAGQHLENNICVDDCPSGQVKINGECKRCTDSNCANCNPSDRSQCFECVDGYVLLDGQCVLECKVNQFRNELTKICEDCQVHCKDCTSNDKCDECQTGYVYDINGSCIICLDPNQVIDGVCKPCTAPNCEKCVVGKTDSCDVCDNGYINNNGVCKFDCDIGYYKVNDECKKCSDSCEICKDPTTCTNCEDNHVIYEGQCVTDCPPHYVEVNGVCEKCTDTDCLKCKSDDTTYCIKCEGNTILYQGDCIAQCPASYYFKDDKCIKCDDHCISCTELKCDICEDGYFLQQGKCVKDCGDGQYEDKVSGKCIDCTTDNCKECNPSGCIVCDLPLVLTLNGECKSVCDDGSFAVNNTCNPCETGCNKCNNNKDCTECILPLYLLDGDCKTSCPDHHTIVNGECVPCTDSKYCFECEINQPSSCEVCDKPKILHVGICVDDCSEGTYYNPETNSCDKCPGECEKCKSKDECTDCVDGFYLNGTKCTSACPSGKVQVDDKCEDCQLDDCGVCKVTSSGTTCIHCDPPKIKNDKNECVIECPPGTRYFAQDNECLTCQRGCELCDQDGSCVHCKKSYFLENGTCKTQCADGFIGNCDKNLCEKCHPACKTCIGATSDKCVECADQYLFQGEICVYQDNCHEGYFPDSLNGQCSKCPQDNCRTCVNAKTCTACDERYTLKDGNCLRDFDIKPLLISSVICSPNTPSNYGPITIKDRDIGSPLHGTKDLTVTAIFEPVGITQNLPAGSISTIIALVNDKDDLTITLGVDRTDNSCAIFIKHADTTNKVNAKPNSCSDNISSAHVIGRVSLVQEQITVDIIVSSNGVTQVNSRTFPLTGVEQLSYDGNFIISDNSVSSTQGHLVSSVFISASKLSDEIANKIASTEPVKENAFSCRNAEKCKEDLKFYVLTNGLVPANTPIELDSTTLVRLSETTFQSFRVESVVHNLKDGSEIKIYYPYQDAVHKTDSDAVALALKVDATITTVQASEGTISIPEIAEANWVKVIISINNSGVSTIYSVEVRDFSGKTLLSNQVVNSKESASTDLFNDAVILSNKALEGIIIHIGADAIKEVLPFVQQKKDDLQCKEFDQNLNCNTCADGYTLNAFAKCENNNHKGCEEVFDFIHILSNEIHEIEVKEDTLKENILTLVIKMRQTSHANTSNQESVSNAVSVRAGTSILSLLSVKNSSNNLTYVIGGQDYVTVNNKNNQFTYHVFIVEFNTTAKTGVAYLIINGVKQPEITITYKDFTKIVLGDVSKDQINTEFRAGLICKQQLTTEALNNIVNEPTPSVDFACLNANYSTGECLECLNNSHPTDPTKCSHSVVGFTNEHITTVVGSIKEEERYITDLRTINRNVSSESYLVTSRFTIHEIPEDGRYNIIKLENRSTENTEDTPLHLFSLNVVFSQSIGTVEVVINTATDGKIVTPINHVTVTPGVFIFISVEFNTNKDFVTVTTDTSDVGTKELEIPVHNLELLQYYATFSIFGIRTPQEEKPFIAEVAHCYIVSNLREDSSVAQVFLEDSKFQIIKPTNDAGCIITSIDKECLLCENTKENVNGNCLDSVAIIAQEKGYSIITEGVVTEAAVSHTINNPFLPENGFNIAFYAQMNTVKYDAVDKIIDLGSIKVLYVENEGTITIRVIVDSISNEFGPYVFEQVQTWLSFTISIQSDKVYIYIREPSGVILDSTIVNTIVENPTIITVQNLDNSKYVANIHLTQENYSKPVLPAPEDKSIQCDLVIDKVCVSSDEVKPIEIYNFSVSPASAPHEIELASLIKSGSEAAIDTTTYKFSVTMQGVADLSIYTSIIKINYGVNYIELKTDKDTQTSYSLELKTFYSTMKEAHKEIVTIDLPSEKENISTAIIISINSENISVLIYDSATNYVKSTTQIKGNLDFVTPSTKLEFGESGSSSNKYLSIRDLSIYLDKSLSITELFNEAVQLTETIQEACVARNSINAVCTKCETSYKLITDNNGDETCVPVGDSFAHNTKLITEVSASSPYTAAFAVNQSIENFTVSINIESISSNQVIDIASISLDSKSIVQLSVDGDKLIVANSLSEKTIEINNVFDCNKAKPFENVVVQVDIINGVTSVTIYDKMIEDTITEKSFGKQNVAIRALNLNVSQTSNAEINYKSGAVTASVNTSESLNSDDIKLLAINHLSSNNSCRGDLTSDEYQLCNLKNNSPVDINNSTNLFNKLGSIISNYTTNNFNPKFQINTKFNVDDLQNSTGSNKNVVFALDNTVGNSIADTYTQTDILSEATEGSCRLTLTAINDRLTLVTSVREIEIIDQSHNLSEYNKIEVFVAVDTINHTIEIRTQADEVTIKQVITGVFEVQPVSSSTFIFKNPEIEATISLSENPKPSEVIDCESFKVKQDHCNIENCLGCLLDQDGKKRCLKCETGFSLLPDSKKCSKSTFVLEKSFIAKP